LFVEELAKNLVGSEPSQDGREKEIPSSLQTLLMAQLDSLGGAKKVAQIGAAVGREFSYELLTAVAQRPEQELRASLDKLVANGLVVRRGMPQAETVIFRHALIQDAAYNTLLREHRKAVHGRIAVALEGQFQDAMETQPEILAKHYAQAGQIGRAINYWLKAGRRAADRSANVEAVKHFTEGIRLAQLLPPSAERERQELDLHIGLGPVIMATKGYGAPESLQVYLNARKLAEKTGAASEQLQVLMGVFNVHYSRAELDAALGTAREYLAIAERSGQSEGRAHLLLGQTHSAMGSFLDARCHLQRALDDCGRSADFDPPAGGLASQKVVALSLIAGVLYALGYSTRGAAATAEAVRLARKSEHALSMALAMVTQLLTPLPGGLEADAAHAKEVVRFCSQHGLKNFEAWALFAQGAIAARRGQAREGIELMSAAVGAAEATGSRLFRPVHLACLASAHARLGEIEEGLLLVRDAIEIVENRGERQSEPALHRLRGEMLAASGTKAAAETELRKALELARAQHALSEEMRIVCSLARLLRAQQREADAVAILAPVCERCSEGFDPLGLENAKRLCDEIRCRAT
jgi:tetratricopeptide (TPR) repeat protein